MGENCGKSIQGISQFLLVVGIIASLALGIAFGRDPRGNFEFLPFLLILAGGCLSSYIFSLVLYGFGRIVENTAALGETVKLLKDIKSQTREISSGPEAVQPVTTVSEDEEIPEI